MKTVDDYVRAAWDALLKGDTARRDELCSQAERLLRAQRAGAEMHGAFDETQAICLPDRSRETDG